MRHALSRGLCARAALLLALPLLLAGCPEDDGPAGGDPDAATPDAAGSDVPLPPGVFEGVPVDDALTLQGLSASVSVVTDERGIPHLYGATLEDLMYALGWIHARDRMPQMELIRRLASGTVAELLGNLDPGVIRDDIVNRTYMFRRVAQQMDERIAAGTVERRVLDAYSAGVNAWLDALRAGEQQLPSPVHLFLPPASFEPWSPVDSLTIGRLQAFELSFDSKTEVGFTERVQKILAAFPADDADPAVAGRAGWIGDVFAWDPPDRTVQYDSYTPSVTPMPTAAMAPLPGAGADAKRPVVPAHLLDRAKRFSGTMRAFKGRDQRRGASNNWAVGPSKSASGHAIVCNDPHLGLDNPALFYFARLVLPATSPDGALNAIGGNFPGIPGFLIGHNQRVAWGLTTSADDRSDAYLEDFTAADGAAPPTVVSGGEAVPVTVYEETVRIGDLGSIQREISFQVLVTDQHRVIVPEVSEEGVAPWETGPQLSYAWSGFTPTEEFRSLLGAMFASSADELIAAFEGFWIANQNITGGDVDGNFFALSPAGVPLREAGAMTWDPATNPEGTAPWLVLPGDGGADWAGLLDQSQGPRAVNPASGFVVTANNDHFGQTLDNHPLNDAVYIGHDYSLGFRAGRIHRLLDGTGAHSPAAGGAKLDLDDMATIQADTWSNIGELVLPAMLTELDKLIAELDAAGSHPELATLAAEAAGQEAAVREAHQRLHDWEGWALSGVAERGRTPDATEQAEAVATTLFNVWLVHAIRGAFDDELAHGGFSEDTDHRIRGFIRILTAPKDALATLDADMNDSLLWDRMDTADVKEGRAEVLGRAFLDALTEAPTLFPADTPMAAWFWGDLHRLEFESILPIPGGSLNLPGPEEEAIFGRGYARPGDQHAVNVCNPGISDTNFTCGSGPMLRMCVELDPAGVRAYQMIPGGQVFARVSPHYADWLPDWLDHKPYYWAVNDAMLVERAESHLVMQAP